MNDPRYLHTEEKQEGETFFDVMNRLIARNKAVTADMDTATAIMVMAAITTMNWHTTRISRS